MRDQDMPKSDGGPASWIVAIAARQDRRAFRSLFGFYAPRIKTLLMRRGMTGDAAEDLAQEALLLVWKKATYFDPRRASASAWIFTIARNLQIDSLRRIRRARANEMHEVLEQEEPPRPDSAFVTSERDDRVRSALQQLSPQQVRVVQLSFFEGRTHADIAQLLGIPLGTVKSRLRLAIDRLREFLGDLT